MTLCLHCASLGVNRHDGKTQGSDALRGSAHRSCHGNARPRKRRQEAGRGDVHRRRAPADRGRDGHPERAPVRAPVRPPLQASQQLVDQHTACGHAVHRRDREEDRARSRLLLRRARRAGGARCHGRCGQDHHAHARERTRPHTTTRGVPPYFEAGQQLVYDPAPHRYEAWLVVRSIATDEVWLAWSRDHAGLPLLVRPGGETIIYSPTTHDVLGAVVGIIAQPPAGPSA